MKDQDQSEVIATAQPTRGRRGLAVVALFGLGVLVISAGLTREVPTLTRVLLVALGVLAIWGAERMLQATSGAVELTVDGLRDSDGVEIVPLAEIAKVERGMFAFKPSNGFLVHTHGTQPRGWRMGLWWRFGKRVGIGGMMPVHQTKVMAERLSMLIEKRDQAD